MFRKSQKVYFGHIDRAGIVYHPRFIDYFHEAYEDFLESLGFAEKNLLETEGVRFPVVNVNVDFHNPVTEGDLLDIEVTVKRIGTKSVCYHFRCTNDGRQIAEGDVTRVAINKAFKSVPIPTKLRKAFEQHLDA